MSDWWQRILETLGQGINAAGYTLLPPPKPEPLPDLPPIAFGHEFDALDESSLPSLSRRILDASPVTAIKEAAAGDLPYEKQVDLLLKSETELPDLTDIENQKALAALGHPILSPSAVRGAAEGGLKAVVPLAERATTTQNLALMLGSGLLGQGTGALAAEAEGALGEAKAGIDVAQNLEKARRAAALADLTQKADQATNLGFTAEGIKGIHDIAQQDVPFEEKLAPLAESSAFALGGLHALGQPGIHLPDVNLKESLSGDVGNLGELKPPETPLQPSPDLHEDFQIRQPTPEGLSLNTRNEGKILGDLDPLNKPKTTEQAAIENKKAVFTLPEQKDEGALRPKWLSTQEIHNDLDPTYGVGRNGVYTRDQFSEDEINAPPDHDLFAWNPQTETWVSIPSKDVEIKNLYSIISLGFSETYDKLRADGITTYDSTIPLPLDPKLRPSIKGVLKEGFDDISRRVNDANTRLGYSRFIVESIPVEYYREFRINHDGKVKKTDRVSSEPGLYNSITGHYSNRRLMLEETPEGEINVPYIIDLFHAATPEGIKASQAPNTQAKLSFDEIQTKAADIQARIADRDARFEALKVNDPDVKHLSDFVTRAGEYLKNDPVLGKIVPKAKEFPIKPGFEIDAPGIGGKTLDSEIQINLPGIIENLYNLGRTDISPTTSEEAGVPVPEMRAAGQHLLDIYSSKPEQLADDLWYSTVFTTLHELAHTEPGSEHGGRFSSSQQKFEAIYNAIIAATSGEHVETLKGFFDGPAALRAADKIHAFTGEDISGTPNGPDSISRLSRVAEGSGAGSKESFREITEKLVPKEVLDQAFYHRKTKVEFDSPFDQFSYFVAKEGKKLVTEHPGLPTLLAKRLGIKYDDLIIHGELVKKKVNQLHKAGMTELRIPEQKYTGGTLEKDKPLDVAKILKAVETSKEQQATPEKPQVKGSEKQRGWVEWVNERHAEDFGQYATEEKFNRYADVAPEDFLHNPFAYRDVYDHINEKIKALEDAGLKDWQSMGRLAMSLVSEESRPIMAKLLSELRSSGAFGERKEGAELGEQKFSFENLQKLYEKINEYNQLAPEPIDMKVTNLKQLAGTLDSFISKAQNDREFANFLFSNGHIVRGLDIKGQKPSELGLVQLSSDVFPFDEVLPKEWRDTNGKYYARPGFAAKFDEYLTLQPKDNIQGAIKVAGDTFRTIKNIQLSSGIPNTWWNTHGLSLAFRRVFSGKPSKIAERFWQVASDPTGVKSLEWLDKHIPEAADGVRHGLTLVSEEHNVRDPRHTSRSWSEVKQAVRENVSAAGEGSQFFENLSKNRLIRSGQKVGNFVAKYGSKLSAAHTELFDVPTFQRSLIGWKLRTWMEVTDELIGRGLTEREAKTQAATFANNAFGGLNTDAAARSKTFRRVMNIMLLAPDWFEANFGLPGLHSNTRFGTGDPAFRQSFERAGWEGSKEFGLLKNTLIGKNKFLYLRMATNYAMFFAATSIVNKLLTDQLDPGLKQPTRLGTVEIPWDDYPDYDKKAFLRLQSTSADPYLLPFVVMASMAQQKDPIEAFKVAAKYYWYRAGIPLKLAATLPPSMKDRFGNPIDFKPYGGEVDAKTKAAKLFREWYSIVSPPYLDAPVSVLSGQQGLGEAGLLGVEFPMRFSQGNTGSPGRPIKNDNEYKRMRREIRRLIQDSKH